MTDDGYDGPSRVTIWWRDTGLQFPQEWQQIEAYVAKLPGTWKLACTTGYLMFQDDLVYLIGLSYDPENATYYGVQAIDAKAVERVNFLRVDASVLR